jgi:hypothetical protein
VTGTWLRGQAGLEGEDAMTGSVLAIGEARDSSRPKHSPHPEEPRSGVSKDAPGGSGDIWSILRDAPAALLRMRAEGVVMGSKS